jgi:hypothetical protein
MCFTIATADVPVLKLVPSPDVHLRPTSKTAVEEI